MRIKWIVFVMGAAMLAATAPTAFAAQVGGQVLDVTGRPVAQIRIAISDTAGTSIGEGTTGADGRYTIGNLAPGDYRLALDPLKSGYIGQTSVVHLGDNGLIVNWTVSRNAPAIALALQGAPPAAGAGGGFLGLSSTALAIGAVSVAGVGGVVGGLAGAGAFSGGGRRGVASPSK